jgi:desulfoferrodoxin (superoxide reductase-like protein)
LIGIPEPYTKGGVAVVRKIANRFICAILFLAALAQAAAAHPPKSVSLVWNPGGSLTVKVDHSVNDPQKHYVNKIIVYVNDKIVAQKEYSSQTNEDGQTDTFSLGALPSGVNIKAEAFCVIMGSATGAITLP